MVGRILERVPLSTRLNRTIDAPAKAVKTQRETLLIDGLPLSAYVSPLAGFENKGT